MLDYLRSVGVNVTLLEESKLSDLEIEAIATGIRGLLLKSNLVELQDLS